MAVAGANKLYCFLVLPAGSEEGGGGVAEAGAWVLLRTKGRTWRMPWMRLPTVCSTGALVVSVWVGGVTWVEESLVGVAT